MLKSILIFLFVIVGVTNTLIAAQPSPSESESRSTTQSSQGLVSNGKNTFLFSDWSGPDLKVWTFKPSAYNANMPAHIVMHGTNSGANRYTDEWASLAITPNVGWYKFPDICAVLSKPICVLLGDADSSPQHNSLRRAPEAMLQGPHRFARGHYYYDYAMQMADENQLPFKWPLQNNQD